MDFLYQISHNLGKPKKFYREDRQGRKDFKGFS
jgi:hypothetical protein